MHVALVCADLVLLQEQHIVDRLDGDSDVDMLDIGELRCCLGDKGISSIVNFVLVLLGGEGISSIVNFVLVLLGGELRGGLGGELRGGLGGELRAGLGGELRGGLGGELRGGLGGELRATIILFLIFFRIID
jgi:hypothetical protein